MPVLDIIHGAPSRNRQRFKLVFGLRLAPDSDSRVRQQPAGDSESADRSRADSRGLGCQCAGPLRLALASKKNLNPRAEPRPSVASGSPAGRPRSGSRSPGTPPRRRRCQLGLAGSISARTSLSVTVTGVTGPGAATGKARPAQAGQRQVHSASAKLRLEAPAPLAVHDRTVTVTPGWPGTRN
jgi:hypothetical protein